MLSILFFILSAICNSVMDTLDFHFESSVFKKLSPDFWNPQVSWKSCKKIAGYHIDGWHLCKSLMIIFLIASVLTYNFPFILWIGVVIYGVVWNVVFSVMFKLLNK